MRDQIKTTSTLVSSIRVTSAKHTTDKTCAGKCRTVACFRPGDCEDCWYNKAGKERSTAAARYYRAGIPGIRRFMVTAAVFYDLS